MKTDAPVETNDTALVKRAQKGDQNAFSRLYRRYLPDIYHFLYTRTGSQADAEDLTADVFFKMLQSISSYQAQGSFRGWLMGIARHTLMDYYRRQYAAIELPLEEFLAHLIAEPIFQPQTKSSAKKKNLLTDILQALPNHYQQVLKLRFLHAYSIKEAAQAMGISENYAKVLQFRALKKAAEIGAAQFEVHDVRK